MIKKITIILLIIITSSCKKYDKSEIMIGTWKFENNPKYYTETKIEKNHVLTLSYESIEIMKSRINKNLLIIYNQNRDPKIDTLKLVCHSKDRIILKRKFMNQYYELSKIENKIDEIDSTNVEKWKKKTIIDFQKRAKKYFKENNIKERNETIDTFHVELPEQIEIPIDTLK
jgi:hypothetical protein